MEQNRTKRYRLEVKGDFACFTRPEMKVERVSYDVMTPSAARAIFEAIYWKPAIRWLIRRIDVLAPIQWTSVRRNEIDKTMSAGNRTGVFIEECRQQRAGLILRDVAYLLHADMLFIPPEERRPHSARQAQYITEAPDPIGRADEKPSKHQGIFERRAGKGQCFNQPYLGCREFSATSFRLLPQGHDQSSDGVPAPIDESRDLGFMLYDMDFEAENNPTAMFFRARMEQGKIVVPDRDSQEVYQ
jgi:CRISPR-associated protein Cas5d